MSEFNPDFHDRDGLLAEIDRLNARIDELENAPAPACFPLEELIAIERLSHEMFSEFDEAGIESEMGPVRRSALKLHRAISDLVIAGRKQADSSATFLTS